jgi:hypothetical protein
MVDPEIETHDLSDYEIGQAELPPSRPPRRASGLWIAGAGLIAAGAIAAYLAFGNRSAPAPTESATAPKPAQTLGGEPAPIAVPPLDQSDPLVRELVKQLSSHPSVAAWLATPGLIRNFVAVVTAVAEGRSPASQLKVLRPSGGFEVMDRDGDLLINPHGYERFDVLAAAAASIDPNGAARLYSTLKPRIEEAYRDLGRPDVPFDRTLERAIVVILQTPTVDGPVQTQMQGGIGYVFADPELEELLPAQKQLLRAGSDNTRTIQSSLRAIALALGIPAERLPAPRT